MDFNLEGLLDVALGNRKAARVLKNCSIVNVFSGEIDTGDVALEDGYIAGIGKFEGVEEMDLSGKFLCPGFIDAHVHIESTMVTPAGFAEVVLPRGTTSVIADPHEIANVMGKKGMDYMMLAGESLPLTIHTMIPSCVPATSFETSGATLTSRDIEGLMGRKGVLGLGELMNYPGVFAKDPEVIAKVKAAGGHVIDGHGAGLCREKLGAYCLAGVATDHECVSVEEARWRIQAGMYVMIREGTAARNLRDLLPLVNSSNWWRFMYCTDDRHLEDIISIGHIDHCIRESIRRGMEPVTAVRLATINAARCYNLKRQGAVAPGYRGDLVVVDNLQDFNVDRVFVMGEPVAERGRMLASLDRVGTEMISGNTINIAPLREDVFRIKGRRETVPVIRAIPGSIETGFEWRRVDVIGEKLVPPEGSDILKIAVVERHRATGNISTAFVEGFGLKGGAIASSVAHDSHNIIVVGDRDDAMLEAVKRLEREGGGYCIVDKERGEALCLPLPVAGLMTQSPVGEVREMLGALLERAGAMGVHPGIDPFMLLSFMALPVIPRLKITDKGLFDVGSFQFIDWR